MDDELGCFVDRDSGHLKSEMLCKFVDFKNWYGSSIVKFELFFYLKK